MTRRFIVESIELESWTATTVNGEERGVASSTTMKALVPGRGPGGLEWVRACADEKPALRAAIGTGHFLILPVTSAIFALVFRVAERDVPLGLGRVDDCKLAATTHAINFRPPPTLPSATRRPEQRGNTLWLHHMKTETINPPRRQRR